MEVFVSWTGDDRDVKNVIVERLHDEDIKCWDSDEYCTSDYSHECIKAIENCEVFIVIVSDASMKKGYVLNEVIKARQLENEGKLNILIYKTTSSPFTEQFEFQLNHISFVTGNLIQRKEQSGGEGNIDLLIKRVKTLIKKRMDGEPEKPFSVNIPKVEGHEITRTGYFVENSRTEALDAIHEAFSRSNVVVLNELFGFGKRSTIKKYVECHRNEYMTVTMLSNPYGSLREFFLLGLNFTNLNSKYFDDYEGDKLLNKKIEQLEKLDEKTMLVIPDIKFEKHPDISLCEKLQTLKCRIVLITQESADQYNDIFPVIRLGRMTNEHLLELFYHHYPHVYDEEKDELKPHLEKFFDEMGGHTKTIELTASVLAHELGVHPEDIPGYLSMKERVGMELKDRIMSQISSLYKIEQPSREETIVLVAASLMAVPYISEQKFKELLREFDITDWQIIKGLADKKWIDIDFKNRTVSIEPLIAQIVLKNNIDNYYIFVNCLEYLYDTDLKNLNIIACELSILMNLLNRLEHILTSIDFEIMAAIPKYIKQYSVRLDDESSELLRNAVACFEERYAEYLQDGEYDNDDDGEQISNGIFDDIIKNLESDYDFDEAKDYSITDLFNEDESDGDDLSGDGDFNKKGLEFIASICIEMFIPMAKLFSTKYYNWVANIGGDMSANANKSFYKPQDNYLDIGDVLGISNEVKELLESANKDNSFDEGSVEEQLSIEVLAMYDGYMKRDYASAMYHFNIVFDLIYEMGELDENNQDVKLFFTLVCGIARNHMLYSNAYHIAMKLCEKALMIDVDVPERMTVVQAYIEALRNSGIYEDTLYSCYDDYIAWHDNNIFKHIEKREDALAEKKNLLLNYAVDLALGERFDEAKKRFESAQKLGKALSADQTVYSAKRIMNALINEGMFDQAIEFISRHFDEQAVSIFSSSCSGDQLNDLQEICDIMYYSQKSEQSSDFQTTDEYIDYYHDFSRENNSLSEKKYYRIADKAMTYDFSDLFDDEISEYALKLAKKAKTMKMHDLAPEAFALVSEAGMRVLGYKHHYVQYVGGAAMADGKIAEMLNGEGKTYTIPLVVFLNYLYGKKVIVTDSSKYLTERNYHWMKGVYDLLGIDNMLMSDYQSDMINSSGEQYGVVYGYLNYVIFNYLKNEIDISSNWKLPRLDCIIVDEIDSVLVDSATQPYILSSSEYDYQKQNQLDIAYKIAQSIEDDDSYYSYNNYSVTLKKDIIPLIENKFRISYSDISNTNKIKKIESLICNAILCSFYYEEDKDYFIDRNMPVGEDKRSGMFYKFSEDITYFLCKKHGLSTDFLIGSLEKKNIPTNYICIRDFFRKFKTICGTTATAVSFKKEFMEIYELDYVAIPPAHPVKRKDYLSPLYMNERTKRQAIIEKVIEKHSTKQPVLLITEDIAESEYFSRALKRRGVENIVLNAKNSDDCVDIIAQAGILGSVMISTNIVNRGVDIVLGGNPQLNTRKELVNMGVDVTGLDKMLYSLPDDQTLNSELYKKYRSVYEKNKAISAKNKEAVITSGGLCVIGTSFFDEPRVEQQTRGRAGRQGDVGESWVFRSLDDSLLKQLLSENYISMVRSSISSDDNLNLKILDKSIKNARQKLHERNFDKIKHHNNASKYIDDAREDFIGRREKLQKGIISIDDILLIWVKNKDIHKLFAKIQKGEKVGDSKLLSRIYAKNSQQLKNLRGINIEKVILKVLQEELRDHFESQNFLNEKNIISCIDLLLVRAWKSYVNIVNDTYSGVSMNDKLMEKYFDEQKNVLLLDMIEKLFNVQTKKIYSPINDNTIPKMNLSKGPVGPNDICPCGSGKKYKKCCGAEKNSLS